jgi:hypothetical protein
MAAGLQGAGKLLHGARTVAQGLGLLVRGEPDARNATRKFLNLKCFGKFKYLNGLDIIGTQKRSFCFELNALSLVTGTVLLQLKLSSSCCNMITFFLNQPNSDLAGSVLFCSPSPTPLILKNQNNSYLGLRLVVDFHDAHAEVGRGGTGRHRGHGGEGPGGLGQLGPAPRIRLILFQVSRYHLRARY